MIELISRSDFAEFELERDGFKLKLVRQPAGAVTVLPAASAAPVAPVEVAPTAPAAPAAPAAAATGSPAAPAGPAAAPAADGLIELKSPIVGTYYSAPGPEAPPFVEVGGRIKKGQVVCIVEAMKVMNEIEADARRGTIVELLVSDGRAGRVSAKCSCASSDPESGVAGERPTMFGKVLIANRGEIALRIIWACRELGHQAPSPSTRRPTTTRCTSSSPTRRSVSVRRSTSHSYLNVSAVISAADITGAEAVHPGYGFLAESAHFAEVCRRMRADLHRAVEPSGDPLAWGRRPRPARRWSSAGVPTVLPGSDGGGQRAGGCRGRGGRAGRLPGADQGGRRRRRHGGCASCNEPDQLETSVLQPRRRRPVRPSACDDVYIERYLRRARATSSSRSWGTPTATWSTCSSASARSSGRHQKLIEESPSVALDPDRCARAMAQAALKPRPAPSTTSTPGRSSSCSTRSGEFFFIEMNTRIQVEHAGDRDDHRHRSDQGTDPRSPPASRSPSPRPRSSANGHSPSSAGSTPRIPDTFRSQSPGKITHLPHRRAGPGSGSGHRRLRRGRRSRPTTTRWWPRSMAHGNTRGEAILRMRRALESFVDRGDPTPTWRCTRSIVADEDFVRGRIVDRLHGSLPRQAQRQGCHGRRVKLPLSS